MRSATAASHVVGGHHRLRWMSVTNPMRSPSSAGGSPETGSVGSVVPRGCRSYATPYTPAPVDGADAVATTPLSAARRVSSIGCIVIRGSMDLFGELAWRGLVYDATEGFATLFASEQVTGYIGFDPTAASLHVGSCCRWWRWRICSDPVTRRSRSLVAARADRRSQRQVAERQLLTLEQVDANVEGIRAQLARFLDFDDRRTRHAW